MRNVLGSTAALLLFLAGSQAHEYKTCAQDKLAINAVNLKPDPVIAGTKLHVELLGTPSLDVTGGKAKIEVNVMGIKLIEESFKVCSDLSLSCPVKKGQKFQAVVQQDVPADAPKLDGVNVKITVENEAGETLSCVAMEVDIKPSEQKRQEEVHVFRHDQSPLSRPTDVYYLFQKWASQFGKTFSTLEEWIRRLDQFIENHYKIIKHNLSGKTWTMAHNEFSHLSFEEFRRQHFGAKIPESVLKTLRNRKRNPFLTQGTLNSVTGSIRLPKEVDWVKEGAVTKVKNQGQCGSCWAFSATGAVESAYFLATKQLVDLSVQQLLDCDQDDMACNGGLMDHAFAWIMRHKGYCSWEEYPYEAVKGPTCKRDECHIVKGSRVSNYTDVEESEEALMAAIARQPVAVAIEADESGMMFYHDGVLTGECGTNLDHGVLAVGYGVYQDGTPYYKLKNSWGQSWGMNGYFLIERNKQQEGGQCGILMAASYPSVEGH